MINNILTFLYRAFYASTLAGKLFSYRINCCTTFEQAVDALLLLEINNCCPGRLIFEIGGRGSFNNKSSFDLLSFA